MFSLANNSGSCWVNACLQCIFRIPEVQERYSNQNQDKENPIDQALSLIWTSKGESGLDELYKSVHTKLTPAGRGIGDSHELLVKLCDKLPFLEKLCRFKIADSIKCKNCSFEQLKEDSVTEYSLSTISRKVPIANCILNSVTPHTIDEWKCEKCEKTGCIKQQLIGSFPKVMVFHLVNPSFSSVEYSSILSLNKNQYALVGVCCFNGGHWWSYGRNMPPGSDWYTLNDRQITQHGPREFPLSEKMRVLIYYRLDK